jgi:2-polyprenyl-6-hydroxyphenyl methylase/3-demethylubiquinone-9 3-methyltransferase
LAVGQSLAIYDQMDWWNPRHSLLQMATVKFDYFHEKIGRLEGTSILDVGCGGGLLAEEFAKRGADVTGVDLSENALETAREHAAAGGLRIRYEIGTAEDLPVGDRLFDAVVCADCLEHVDDLDRVIGQVSKVLKNGGAFCYDTVNRNLLSKLLVVWIVDPLLRQEYRILNVSEKAYAVHDWNKFIKPEELTELMARHGLANRETKGIQFAGFRKGGFKAKVAGSPRIAYVGYAAKER